MKRFKNSVSIAGIFAGAVLLTSCDKEVFPLYNEIAVPVNYKYEFSLMADSLQQQLTSTYRSSNGNYYVQDNQGTATFHYWPNAHVLDVFADAYVRTKAEAYVPKMKALLNGIKTQNNNKFPNAFYDDMGWLALSSLRAYELTKDDDYLQASLVLWEDMKKGITDVQGGGMGWSKDRPNFKNTPANGPAIIFAARLYRLQNKPEDLATATSLYDWLRDRLVDKGNFVIWDGINYDGTGTISKSKYTYNAGLFVGAALEMYKTTKTQSYLNDAIKAAQTAITDGDLSPSGLLKDEGQGDGGLFKGIFVRYLTLLVNEPTLPAADRDKLLKFLKYNAETLYAKGITRPALAIGSGWNKPATATTDLTTQLSGIMLIEAAAQLKASGALK